MAQELVRFGAKWREIPRPQTLTFGEGDSLDNDLVLEDTEQVLSLHVTASQYEKILSSAINGANIYFPDEYIEVIYPLIKAGKTMFCAEVEDCIETDVDVQTAITNMLIEQGLIDPDTVDADTTTVDDRMTEAQQDSEIKDAPAGCDMDILWAGIKEIVIRLDDNARTILEQANVINDIAERYSSLLEAIPIVGDIAASLAKQLTEVIPDILNSYNAYSSEAHIEELTCALFELVCDDCRYPTFEEVANTVATDAFPSMSNWEIVTLTAVAAQFVQTGAFTPTLVWHSMLLFELFTLYLGARFNGNSGTTAIAFWAALGEDEPSDDWELLCDGCTDQYLVPATGNGFTGAGDILIIPVPTVSTVRIEYLSGTWDMATGWIGSWAGDPDTQDAGSLIPAANVGALVARDPDNTSNWVVTGADYTFNVVAAVSDLIICANDVETGYGDNEGELFVRVTIT